MELTKSSVLARAELEALASEFEILSEQVRAYEALKSGAIVILKAATLDELPGILIRARIAKGLSQRQLAKVLGVKEQQIQRYESERYSSASLRKLVQVSNALEINIKEVAEFKTSSAKRKDISSEDIQWDMFPVKEMYRRNWFKGFSGSLSVAIANAEELVKKFVTDAIPKPTDVFSRTRVRANSHLNNYALLAWRCRVITLAQMTSLKGTYTENLIEKDWLLGLAQVSSLKEGPRRAKEYLERSGISLVVEPHLSHTYLDGAAILLPDGRPIVALTLRYDRLDNFWFVLFHELIHVMKHLHKGHLEDIFDDLDAEPDELERETDQLAGAFLIADDVWETALPRYIRSVDSINEFAKELKISPAIVAGRIRKEADNYTIFTEMVGQGKVRKYFPEVNFAQ
jgi:HTH-type transcriptional regulator/antitoxin HigA